jgi:hypothetical protein
MKSKVRILGCYKSYFSNLNLSQNFEYKGKMQELHYVITHIYFNAYRSQNINFYWIKNTKYIIIKTKVSEN